MLEAIIIGYSLDVLLHVSGFAHDDVELVIIIAASDKLFHLGIPQQI